MTTAARTLYRRKAGPVSIVQGRKVALFRSGLSALSPHLSSPFPLAQHKRPLDHAPSVRSPRRAGSDGSLDLDTVVLAHAPWAFSLFCDMLDEL